MTSTKATVDVKAMKARTSTTVIKPTKTKQPLEAAPKIKTVHGNHEEVMCTHVSSKSNVTWTRRVPIAIAIGIQHGFPDGGTFQTALVLSGHDEGLAHAVLHLKTSTKQPLHGCERQVYTRDETRIRRHQTARIWQNYAIVAPFDLCA